MARLEIANLRKEFDDGAIVAVDDVTLDVSDGEFIVIVGPSGCGKSTTLNCVAGLDTPTSGQIALGGEDITDERPQDRDIAMVFQNYALYPHMSVRENLNFGLRVASDHSTADIESMVDGIAELLEISELLDQKPKDLSGGQQQRVALGRAIVREPALFLMDEPLSNLDAKLRTQMRTEIQELQNQLGITTLYVTHDQTEAMTMGDRIMVMYGGEVQQVASPLTLYHRPANRFVAGFIGNPGMNFFNVEKRINNETVVFEHDAFEYRVSDPPEALLNAPEHLTLGVRPETFYLSETEQNAIQVPVSVVEPMGDVNYVYFEVDGSRYTVRLDGSEFVREGETAAFSFDPDGFHAFDPESGDALVHPESDYESMEMDYVEIAESTRSV